MLIARVALMLVVIAALVLLAAYVTTRNSQYLAYLKQLLQYAGWLSLLLGLLFLISRLIRI